MRRAKLEKVPYVLVVGDDDVAAGTVGVNTRGSERPERGVAVPAFVARLRTDVNSGTDLEESRQRMSAARPPLGRLALGVHHERIWGRRQRWAGPGPCVFCRILASGVSDEEAHIVWRHPSGRAFAILNAYPYTSGHLMVMPTRHAA